MKKLKTTRQGTRRAFRCKKAAALAVSLWIAGGGLACAANPSASTQIKINPWGTDIAWSNDDAVDRQNGKYGSAAVPDGKTLSIGGTWTKPENTAGYYFIAGDVRMVGSQVNGYTLNVNGATFNSGTKYAEFYGAHQITTGSPPYALTNNAVTATTPRITATCAATARCITPAAASSPNGRQRAAYMSREASGRENSTARQAAHCGMCSGIRTRPKLTRPIGGCIWASAAS